MIGFTRSTKYYLLFIRTPAYYGNRPNTTVLLGLLSRCQATRLNNARTAIDNT